MNEIKSDIFSESFDSSGTADKLYCSGTLELNIDLAQTRSFSSSSLSAAGGGGGNDDRDDTEHRLSSSLENANEERETEEEVSKECGIDEGITILSSNNERQYNTSPLTILCSNGSHDEDLLDYYGLSLSFESDEDYEIDIDSQLNLMEGYDYLMYDKVAIEKGLLDITFEEIFYENTREEQTSIDITTSFLDNVVKSNRMLVNESELEVDRRIYDSVIDLTPFFVSDDNDSKVKKLSTCTMNDEKCESAPERTTVLCLTKKAFSGFDKRQEHNTLKGKPYKKITNASFTELDYQHLLSSTNNSNDETYENDVDHEVNEEIKSPKSKFTLTLAKKLMKKIKKKRDQNYIQIEEVNESSNQLSPPSVTKVGESYYFLPEDCNRADDGLNKSPKETGLIQDLLHDDSINSRQASFFANDKHFSSYHEENFHCYQFNEATFVKHGESKRESIDAMVNTSSRYGDESNETSNFYEPCTKNIQYSQCSSHSMLNAYGSKGDSHPLEKVKSSYDKLKDTTVTKKADDSLLGKHSICSTPSIDKHKRTCKAQSVQELMKYFEGCKGRDEYEDPRSNHSSQKFESSSGTHFSKKSLFQQSAEKLPCSMKQGSSSSPLNKEKFSPNGVKISKGVESPEFVVKARNRGLKCMENSSLSSAATLCTNISGNNSADKGADTSEKGLSPALQLWERAKQRAQNETL